MPDCRTGARRRSVWPLVSPLFMRQLIIDHPIASIVLALIAGAILAALYMWRSLGGRFLP